METPTSFSFTVIKAGGGVLKNFTTSILLILMSRIAGLISANKRPFLVVSAFKGVTNKLEEVYSVAMSGELSKARELASLIFIEHMAIVNNLGIDLEFKLAYSREVRGLRNQLNRMMDLMSPKMRELGPVGEDLSEKMKAEVLSYGEKLAVCVLKSSLAGKGFNVYAIPTDDFMMGTTANGEHKYTNAIVETGNMAAKLRGLCRRYDSTISMSFVSSRQMRIMRPLLLTAGFIGVDEDGETMNFGREGSDTSAVTIAHALGQKEVYFLKDVEADKPITSERWADLQEMEIATGSHLIGGAAIEYAIEFGMDGVIVDFETGKQYRITC